MYKYIKNFRCTLRCAGILGANYLPGILWIDPGLMPGHKPWDCRGIPGIARGMPGIHRMPGIRVHNVRMRTYSHPSLPLHSNAYPPHAQPHTRTPAGRPCGWTSRRCASRRVVWTLLWCASVRWAMHVPSRGCGSLWPGNRTLGRRRSHSSRSNLDSLCLPIPSFLDCPLPPLLLTKLPSYTKASFNTFISMPTTRHFHIS